MSEIQIYGQFPLKGEISIQGAKNAVLPMMAAALLHRGVTVLMNVPVIRDVSCMADILEYLGCRLERQGGCLAIDGSHIENTAVPDHFVSAMR